MNGQHGRSCPLNYRYQPASVARSRVIETETLYVVGGLYGNEQALDCVEKIVNQDLTESRVCFNGDFNWFNTSPHGFERVNRTVMSHDALRGNVETELAAQSPEADCGCGYPAFVADEVVQRSNQIITQLKQTAAEFSELTQWMSELPMFLRYSVGMTAVSVLHGDPESLAGWGLAREVIEYEETKDRLRQWFADLDSSIVACTHTCVPFLYCAQLPGSEKCGVVINNGAAGMPNFSETRFGLVSRIATTPCSVETLYGCKIGSAGAEVYLDAIKVPYDTETQLEEFDRLWPVGSAAALSYRERLLGIYDYHQNAATIGI